MKPTKMNILKEYLVRGNPVGSYKLDTGVTASETLGLSPWCGESDSVAVSQSWSNQQGVQSPEPSRMRATTRKK